MTTSFRFPNHDQFVKENTINMNFNSIVSNVYISSISYCIKIKCERKLLMQKILSSEPLILHMQKAAFSHDAAHVLLFSRPKIVSQSCILFTVSFSCHLRHCLMRNNIRLNIVYRQTIKNRRNIRHMSAVLQTNV